MKYLSFAFGFMISISTPVQGQFMQKEFKGKNGAVLPYQILYPDNYNTDESFPVILFLHGAGERGNDNELQMKHGSKLFLGTENREKFPAIVIFPQCASNDSWANYQRNKKGAFRSKLPEEPKPSLQLTIELLEMIIAEEKVDQNRLYVMGLSMGGFGTFEMLARFPKRFAAAVPICGGGIPRMAKKFADTTSVWIFHGEADGVVPVKLSRLMHQALLRKKADVKYTEYPGVNHNSWDPAFAEPNLLNWLFSKKLMNQ